MMTQNTTSPIDTTEPKSLRSFFIIWGGQVSSLLGSSLVQFALIWYLTMTTGSAMVLALASLIGLLPQILLGPIAGTLVDRWNRRIVMIMADTVIAIATALLALCFLVSWVPLWLLYLVMVIRSLGSAFHRPAMDASTPLLIPEKHLTRIAGLNQGLYSMMNIVIPALAALLLDWLPMQGILAIDVGTAMIAIGPLVFIHIPNPSRADLTSHDQGTEQESKPSLLDDLRAGFAFVWGWTGLRIIVGLVMVGNLFFAPANALFPLLVTKTFGGDALELAWVQGSVGLGLGIWGGFKNRMLTSILGLLLQSIGFLIVGFAPNSAFLLLLITMGIIGVANPLINSPFFAALQATIPNAIQGRVLTLISSSFQATTPIGLLIAGPLADRLVVQLIYILCGLVALMNSIIFFTVPAVLYFEAQGKQIVEA